MNHYQTQLGTENPVSQFYDDIRCLRFLDNGIQVRIRTPKALLRNCPDLKKENSVLLRYDEFDDMDQVYAAAIEYRDEAEKQFGSSKNHGSTVRRIVSKDGIVKYSVYYKNGSVERNRQFQVSRPGEYTRLEDINTLTVASLFWHYSRIMMERGLDVNLGIFAHSKKNELHRRSLSYILQLDEMQRR